ncbi:hypothetical protein [Humidisolicoccus flavus]|uniref:hypothetical protein n=1 Tax=Humidisolicoccus flavus TaxID=3111414 RepID=UPI003247E771
MSDETNREGGVNNGDGQPLDETNENVAHESPSLDFGDTSTSEDPIVEPTVIAPSTLRGPHSVPDSNEQRQDLADIAAEDAARDSAVSYDEAVPTYDELAREDAPTAAFDAQSTAAAEPAPVVAPEPTFAAEEPAPLVEPESRLDREPVTERESTHDDDLGATQAMPVVADDEHPPPLVEPQRPAPPQADPSVDAEVGAALRSSDPGSSAAHAGGVAGSAAAGSAVAGAAAARSTRDNDETTRVETAKDGELRESSVNDATVALDAQRTDAEEDLARTRALPAQTPTVSTRSTEPEFEVDLPAGDDAATRKHAAIEVDDDTARAAAAGGTPIVLVEAPLPPTKRGVRGVGFAVSLLATLIFGALLAGGMLLIGFLFDRTFDLVAEVQTLWLQPTWILPVAVFFVGYLLLNLIVNRAGWWAHVLGGFLVAALVYAAVIAGNLLENFGGWGAYAQLPNTSAAELTEVLLTPLSVLTFVLAREVPIWVGGIVARRGRKVKAAHRDAVAEFDRENEERMAVYETSRTSA